MREGKIKYLSVRLMQENSTARYEPLQERSITAISFPFESIIEKVPLTVSSVVPYILILKNSCGILEGSEAAEFQQERYAQHTKITYATTSKVIRGDKSFITGFLLL